MQALVFPGAIFAIFFVLNLIIWGEKSSGAVPFGTLFALLCMWFGISVPLTFVGSYFGQSDPNYKERSATADLHRAMPEHNMHATVESDSNCAGKGRWAQCAVDFL